MKWIYNIIICCCFAYSCTLVAQNTITVNAKFNPENNTIVVAQQITITNTSSKVLDSVFLYDWNNSYANRDTELAKRFADEFSGKLHFAKDHDKGATHISSILSEQHELQYSRKTSDVIAINLHRKLKPNDRISLQLDYTLQLPSDKFTRFGISSKKNVKLKEWYLIPAKLTDDWVYYSNKDLDDLYFPNSNINLTITTPKTHKIFSDLDRVSSQQNGDSITVSFTGKNRINSETHFTINNNFSELATDKFTYVTNINDDGIGLAIKAIIHDKIAYFLHDHLGAYPHEKLLLSEAAYKRNPVYGLNQLPNFIRPFPDGFQYEIKILKATIAKYIKNTINTNPRYDYWLNDALESYLIIKYVEANYPDMKILGGLAKIWGIRSFELAKKKFNDQYYYFNLYTARKNLDQKLSTPKDGLLKYNANISNKNKAGVGLLYLEDYIGKGAVSTAIKEFYDTNKLKNSTSANFIEYLQSKTDKDISWFLTDYVHSDYKIDYVISDVIDKGNKLSVKLKNKETTATPISLYQLIDGKIISKHYVDGFTGHKTIEIPNNKPSRIIINYEGIIPEYNLRNNTKTIKPHLFNKPLKFTFVKDAEASNYNQVFYVPELGYNLYDGFSPGLTLTNKTLLPKAFTYKIKPMYGLESEKLVGSISLNHTSFYKDKNLFSTVYGLSYQQYHYEQHLKYQRFNPYIIFNFKNKNDLRDNAHTYILARNISVEKEKNEFITDDTPNYNVFNIKFGTSDRNLINYNAFKTDLQLSKKFGKLSASYEYRKLFSNNRQLNFRAYAGTFLYNNTNSDFFSFALDRPTDYLFDYNYYGRSESTGIYSQQIIIADGGFKSKLNTPLANDWMMTLNTGTTLWKYILAYGDVGLLQNNGNAKFVYDSGIHLNLVPDYFELYFPVYSNLGWEISHPQYANKIRFKVTLTPKVLIGLFTRKWL
ncbi:MAG: metalloprotease [Flavobacteriaceae bacterium]